MMTDEQVKSHKSFVLRCKDNDSFIICSKISQKVMKKRRKKMIKVLRTLNLTKI